MSGADTHHVFTIICSSAPHMSGAMCPHWVWGTSGQISLPSVQRVSKSEGKNFERQANFTRLFQRRVFFCWEIGDRFNKSMELGIFHRDSSIHLRPTPTPSFYSTKSFSKVQRWSRKVWRRAQTSLWNWPQIFNHIQLFMAKSASLNHGAPSFFGIA